MIIRKKRTFPKSISNSFQKPLTISSHKKIEVKQNIMLKK